VNDDELGAPRRSLAHEPSLGEGALSPPLPGDLIPAEKMNELLRYFVSDEYARVRQALGVTVA